MTGEEIFFLTSITCHLMHNSYKDFNLMFYLFFFLKQENYLFIINILKKKSNQLILRLAFGADIPSKQFQIKNISRTSGLESTEN